jgi:uncharacterized membrane protein
MILALAGLFFVVVGVWALVDPQSFYDQVATFPPYNAHLFHDVGAFQVGLGAALLLPIAMTDAALVGLTAVGVGAALHAVSHIIDRDLGGRSTDPIALSAFAAVVLVGAALRNRELRGRRTP